MEYENYYKLETICGGDWYTNALIENEYDALQVAKLYSENLGYAVRIVNYS